MVPAACIKTLILALISLGILNIAMADPRTSVAIHFCNKTLAASGTILADNFVSAMNNLSSHVNANGYGTSIAGIKPNAVYALYQCFGDLNTVDCKLCFSQIRSHLPVCYPNTGGRLFLDGCFGRYENYSFFNEIISKNDTTDCSYSTNSSDSGHFDQAVKEIVGNVSLQAQNNQGFAVGSAINSDFSVYVLAQCWKNLSNSLCSSCLHAAASAIVLCSPATEGRALYSGCFLRYSTSLFWNVYETSSNSSASSHRNNGLIIGLTSGLVCFLLVCIVLYYCISKCNSLNNLFIRKKNKIAQTIEAFLVTYESLGPKRYRYSDLKKITKKFSEKLGQGGYGAVFKGKLRDGRLVAVKVLSDAKGNGDEFVNEVASIGRTSHVNVVSLLGFSSEGSRRALIYEFMSNGSLEKYIYSDNLKSTLGWEKLYQIAVGIAQGLEYLHRGCIARIVHFDIKPHNILLDHDFCPKISDFGLAKLHLRKESKFSAMDARGTIGYIAPEVFSRNFGVVSSKSDVYSYGMMVMEMVGGRNTPMHSGADSSSQRYFPHWIYDHLHQIGHMAGVNVTGETEEIAKKMILVGLWCIQAKPESRPSMSRVVDMLESSIDDLEMPPKP